MLMRLFVGFFVLGSVVTMAAPPVEEHARLRNELEDTIPLATRDINDLLGEVAKLDIAIQKEKERAAKTLGPAYRTNTGGEIVILEEKRAEKIEHINDIVKSVFDLALELRRTEQLKYGSKDADSIEEMSEMRMDRSEKYFIQKLANSFFMGVAGFSAFHSLPLTLVGMGVGAAILHYKAKKEIRAKGALGSNSLYLMFRFHDSMSRVEFIRSQIRDFILRDLGIPNRVLSRCEKVVNALPPGDSNPADRR